MMRKSPGVLMAIPQSLQPVQPLVEALSIPLYARRASNARLVPLVRCKHPVHTPRRFHYDAHQDKERHRHELIVQHGGVSIQRHQQRGQLEVGAPDTEDKGKENQCEGD